MENKTSLLNYVSYVPRVLSTLVPHLPYALRALVPAASTALRAPVPHVHRFLFALCLTCFVPYVFS